MMLALGYEKRKNGTQTLQLDNLLSWIQKDG